MRNEENNQTEAAGYDWMQHELSSLLSGDEPIATTIDLIFCLVKEAKHPLDLTQYPHLMKLLSMLNAMQVVQFEMGRMVSHG